MTARPLREFAERWTPELGGLLVLGPTGVGKTASVLRALHRLVQAATSPGDPILRTRWTCASAIALARRRAGLGAGEAEEIRRAFDTPILVIDELGPEPLDPALHDVLDRRYQAERVTIATSGMTLAELRERYGAARIRRIMIPLTHGGTALRSPR